MTDPVEGIIERLERAHWLMTGGPGAGEHDLEMLARFAAVEVRMVMAQLGHLTPKPYFGCRPDPWQYRKASNFAIAEKCRRAVTERLLEAAQIALSPDLALIDSETA